MIVGYARVSSASQSLDIQRDALTAAGAEQIFEEKATGTNAKRSELQRAIEFVRKGDTFMVTRLDRLARSVHDLHNILNTLEGKGVTFIATEQGSANMGDNMGRLLLSILGAVAEFETAIRKDRQMEGIQAAKAKGVYKGRKPSLDREKIMTMLAEGKRPTDIARALGADRSSVYRIANLAGKSG